MTATPPASRRIPVWLWIVIAVIVLAVIGAAVFLLIDRPTSVNSVRSPAPSRSQSPSASATPTPTPSQSAVAGGGTFDSSMDDYVASALDTQNTAVLSDGGVFTNPVDVVAAASDQNGPLSPDAAVDAMAFMFDPSTEETWNLALPASTIAAYRAGPYGYFFPVGAIVARSADSHVFSFVGHDRLITTMYMVGSEDLLLGH
jgi:hypothetical protein